MGGKVDTRVVAALVAALVLAGCGTKSADVFVVKRTGSIPGARLTLLVNDAGTVRCNNGPEKTLTSKQLLTARGIRDDLEGKVRNKDKTGPIDKDLHLPPRPGSTLSYALRGAKGDVAFSDNSLGQPPVFFRIGLFVRDLAKHVCGLPR